MSPDSVGRSMGTGNSGGFRGTAVTESGFTCDRVSGFGANGYTGPTKLVLIPGLTVLGRLAQLLLSDTRKFNDLVHGASGFGRASKRP